MRVVTITGTFQDSTTIYWSRLSNLKGVLQKGLRLEGTLLTCLFSFVLTVWKGQNTDDEEEGNDQDESHPQVTVRVSIVSENKGRLEAVKTY